VTGGSETTAWWCEQCGESLPTSKCEHGPARPHTGVSRVHLPLVPQSFNQTRYGHWTRAWKATTELNEALGYALLAARVPRPLAVVRAEATMTFPTRRRRDEGNFRTPLEKALGDALVAGRFLADDTPDQFRFGGVLFAVSPGETRTEVLLTWETKQ